MNYFRTLDWGPWLYSLLKGAIGAGASSLTAMLSTLAVDPNDFALGSSKSLKVSIVCFLFSFSKYCFTFLQANALPPVKIVTTVETVSQTHYPEAKTTTTVEETKIVPAPVATEK
jgi:hypothetical protein